MTQTQYCPDCGEQCGARDDACPECDFPLALEVVVSSDAVTIRGRERDKWKRLSALLRRSGMRVSSKGSGGWSTSGAWWLLPSAGVMILLFSIFLGGPIADMIWPPPKAVAVPVVDLGAGSEEEQAEPTDADIDENVASLAEAFKTSDAQRELTVEQNLDLSRFVDRIRVKEEAIASRMAAILMKVVVDDKRGSATLLPDGFFFMERTLNEGAFRRVNRNVTRKGVLVTEPVYLEPRVSFPGEEKTHAGRRVRESANLMIELMISNLAPELDIEYEFERQIDLGETVWVGRILGDDIEIEELEITSQTSIGDVDYWILDGSARKRDGGSPVFDITGKVTGVLVVLDGRPTVVSLRTIRERTPLIYKELR